ncbi:hypothetical protein V1527DRAFT_144244 [Lipomyces starkeyi]
MASNRKSTRGFVITICCWCCSAIMLFSLVGVVIRHNPSISEQETVYLSQGFFYGIFAAALYVCISILLAIYTCSAHSVHLSPEDRRAVENTPLMVQTMVFEIHLVGGGAVFSTIEGWSFMDAVYFADYTILTIGIGNITPKTHLGRSLLFPYAASGIMTVGLIISSIRSFVKGQRMMNLRMKIEKARLDSNSGRSTQPNGKGNSTTDLAKDDFLELQAIKSKYTRRHRWTILLSSVFAWFFLWLVSAGIFRRSESGQQWTYFDALYFTYTSLTTIGYGDLYPTSNFGTAFFVFWSPLAVPVLTLFISVMGDTVLLKVKEYIGKLRFSKIQIVFRTSNRRKRQKQHGSPTSNVKSSQRCICDDVERCARKWGKMAQHFEHVEAAGQPSSAAPTEESVLKSMDNSIYYCYLLAEEIRKLAGNIGTSPDKKCSSEDWMRLFALLELRNADRDDHALSSLPPTQGDGLAEQHPDSIRSRKGQTRVQLPMTMEAEENMWMLEHLAGRLVAALKESLDMQEVDDS